MPDIPRARCYIHTWKDMKIKLRQLGIVEKKQLRTYREDFYQLLYLDDYKEYLAAFRTLTRRSWNLVSTLLIFSFSILNSILVCG